MSKKIVYTAKAPKPIGAYSQAVWAGNMLFLSGQIAINPSTNTLTKATIEEETTQVMENIKAVLTEAGLTFNQVIKASIFLSDMNMFGQVNKIYGSYFDEANAPARECVAVATLPKHVNVEISIIAMK